MNIGYKLIKNCMAATAEKAPYLGMAIPVGSLAYDNILKEMIKAGTKMTQPTAKFFLDALYEFAAEKIAADVVRINLGTVSIYPMIDGSFDSEDAPFNPKRNSLYVGASLSQELRDRVAGIAPDFAGDVSLGTVKLHSCMDLETEVFKVIRGTEDFCLAGANVVVPDGEDESLGLYAKDGVTKVTDIVVSETDGGQQLFCHLSDAVAVPKGTYKVRLASHGLDPTDPLTVATLTVTLVEAVTPPAPIAQTSDGSIKVYTAKDGGQSETFTYGHEWKLGGSGFNGSAGGFIVSQALLFPEGTEGEPVMMGHDASADGTEMTLARNDLSEDIPTGTYPDAVISLMATKGGVMEGLDIPIKLIVEA